MIEAKISPNGLGSGEQHIKIPKWMKIAGVLTVGAAVLEVTTGVVSKTIDSLRIYQALQNLQAYTRPEPSVIVRTIDSLPRLGVDSDLRARVSEFYPFVDQESANWKVGRPVGESKGEISETSCKFDAVLTEFDSTIHHLPQGYVLDKLTLDIYKPGDGYRGRDRRNCGLINFPEDAALFSEPGLRGKPLGVVGGTVLRIGNASNINRVVSFNVQLADGTAGWIADEAFVHPRFNSEQIFPGSVTDRPRID